MAVNKDGKYTKLTDDTIKRLEEVFSLDASIAEACFYANISTQTYYNWIKDEPAMKERFDALREKPVLKARQTVVKSLDDPDNAFKYLERKRKKEFSLRTEQDITFNGKVITGFNFIKNGEDPTNNSSSTEAGESLGETT